MKIAVFFLLSLSLALIGCDDLVAPPEGFPLTVIEQATLHGAESDSISLRWHLDGAAGGEEYCLYLSQSFFDMETYTMTITALDTVYHTGVDLEYLYTGPVTLTDIYPVSGQPYYAHTFFRIAVMSGSEAGSSGPGKYISP
jgi:hypothetical protein